MVETGREIVVSLLETVFQIYPWWGLHRASSVGQGTLPFSSAFLIVLKFTPEGQRWTSRAFCLVVAYGPLFVKWFARRQAVPVCVWRAVGTSCRVVFAHLRSILAYFCSWDGGAHTPLTPSLERALGWKVSLDPALCSDTHVLSIQWNMIVPTLPMLGI